jgi:glycosyltransferase involved in cell wall biosynthesis
MPAILLISPEPWDAHAVSKHHYARSLAAQGCRVLFLDPPERGRRGIILEYVAGCPGLQRVRAGKVAPGLRWLPGRLRRWFEQHWLQQLEQRAGCPIGVIWLFENSRFFDLRFAGSRLKIYHQVDLNQAFHPETAARTADVCFCTLGLIRQRLLPHNPRCHRLQHGVAISKPPGFLQPAEQQRFSPGQIQAMYVGNLEMTYLDVELLAKVIELHLEVRFHLVGGYRRDGALFQQLGSAANVVWWGQVESSQIPTLLAHADLLMVCYQAQHHADQANPHKLMEYLASGRTVVATYTAEFAAQRHLLAMAEPGSNAGYTQLFASVLANIHTWNDPERIEARRSFALDHSYQRQLERIQSHLQQHGLSLPAA